MENINWSNESRLDNAVRFPTVINGVAGVSVVKHEMNGKPYYCGYVLLSNTHPLYGKSYWDIEEDFDIPGGLTFSEPQTDCNWWLGFNTANVMAENWNRAKTTKAVLKLAESLKRIK